MAEIKRTYIQSLPKMQFVGRCYGEQDKQNGTYSHIWEEWFGGKLFEPLKIDYVGEEPFEDCNAFYGLMRLKEGEPFQYWIGVFMPLEASIPDGYQSIEFDEGEIAVGWIYGKEPDIYTCCSLDSIMHEGYEWAEDKNGAKWCFERYVSPRFTTPDDKGNVILDMCFYVRKITNK